MMAPSGLMNHSDVATAATFNVEVKLEASAAAAAAASAAGDESTRGQYDQEPASIAGTILATATATMSAAVDVAATERGRIDQLEQGVDKLMKKMGINGMTVSMLLLGDYCIVTDNPIVITRTDRRTDGQTDLRCLRPCYA